MEDLVKKLKELVDEYGMVDVGEGAAEMLGVTQMRLDRALATLYADGYSISCVFLPLVTVKKSHVMTKVLCRPDMDVMLRTNFNIKAHHIIYTLDE